MARKSRVSYWESRHAFGCWHKGRQVILAEGEDDSMQQGPVFMAAVKVFAQLEAGQPIRAATSRKTLNDVWEAYSTWMRSNRKPGTLEIRERCLKMFMRRFGGELAEEIAPYRIHPFVEQMSSPRVHGGHKRLTRWTAGTVTVRQLG